MVGGFGTAAASYTLSGPSQGANSCSVTLVTPAALSWYRAQVLAKTDDLKTSACCTAVAPPPLVRGVCF